MPEGRTAAVPSKKGRKDWENFAATSGNFGFIGKSSSPRRVYLRQNGLEKHVWVAHMSENCSTQLRAAVHESLLGSRSAKWDEILSKLNSSKRKTRSKRKGNGSLLNSLSDTGKEVWNQLRPTGKSCPNHRRSFNDRPSEAKHPITRLVGPGVRYTRFTSTKYDRKNPANYRVSITDIPAVLELRSCLH